MHFEWDLAKEFKNLEKHGVSFTEARMAFADPLALVRFDADHSDHRELRWRLLGRSGRRILTVRYTHRPLGVIRIFGAGSWRSGRLYYEAFWQDSQN